METRKILIANTKTQTRYSIETNATTLGELQDQMSTQGIDFSGMTFTEGISQTQLLSRDSLLPTNVMFKGQPTNNLVMLLTNPNKQIASGAMSRKEAYESIKAGCFQEAVKEKFGRNFTQVPTADLEKFLSDNSEETGVTDTCLDENGEVVVKEVPPMQRKASHAATVNWLYDGIKQMVSENLLVLSDVEALTELTTELAARLKELSPRITDEDIDSMLANL